MTNPNETYLQIDDMPAPVGRDTYFEKVARETKNQVDYPDRSNVLGRRIAQLMELNPAAGLYWSREDLDEMAEDEKELIVKDFILVLKIMWRNHPRRKMSRDIEQVENEFSDLEASYLDFSPVLGEATWGPPYWQRHSVLRREMYDFGVMENVKRNDKFLDVRLSNLWGVDENLPIEDLGKLQIALQKLFFALARTYAGSLKQKLKNRVTLRQKRVATGSVVYRLVIGEEQTHDLFQVGVNSPEVGTFKLLQKLLDAGFSRDSLLRVADSLDSNTLRRYEDLLSALEKNNLSMDLTLANYGGKGSIRRAMLQSVDIGKIKKSVKHATEVISERFIEEVGWFEGIKANINWFEMNYLDENGNTQSYQGKSDPRQKGLLDGGVVRKQRYTFHIKEKTHKNALTSKEEKIEYVLMGFVPLADRESIEKTKPTEPVDPLLQRKNETKAEAETKVKTNKEQLFLFLDSTVDPDP